MNSVRCMICRLKFPNVKKLTFHYLQKHSKIQIIKEVLKNGVFNVIPNFLIKSKRSKKQKLYKTVFLHEHVQIDYNDEAIIIEDTSEDNVIELTFDESHKYNIPILEPSKNYCRTRSKFNKKEKKNNLFRIAIKKLRAYHSLNEATGEFYECHCMDKGQQTEAVQKTEKTEYTCDVCGSSFITLLALTDHQKFHSYYCKVCNHVFNTQHVKPIEEKYLVRIYICHLCGYEFGCKEVLIGHLGYHFEQQTFETILNMEQDYNVFGLCHPNFASEDYYKSISNIIVFLTHPYDHFCNRNVFMKVICDICYQEFYAYEYERHLKMVHFLH